MIVEITIIEFSFLQPLFGSIGVLIALTAPFLASVAPLLRPFSWAGTDASQCALHAIHSLR